MILLSICTTDCWKRLFSNSVFVKQTKANRSEFFNINALINVIFAPTSLISPIINANTLKYVTVSGIHSTLFTSVSSFCLQCVYRQYKTWPFELGNYLCRCKPGFWIDNPENVSVYLSSHPPIGPFLNINSMQRVMTRNTNFNTVFARCVLLFSYKLDCDNTLSIWYLSSSFK